MRILSRVTDAEVWLDSHEVLPYIGEKLVVQIRHAGEQVMMHWDKRKKALTLFKNLIIISFACLPPVCPWLIHLLSSMAVMYHVNDQQ